jgi:hypothetical protein
MSPSPTTRLIATPTGRESGGGVARSGGVLSLKNTLIGENADKSASTKHPDCSERSFQGYNLIQDLTGCTVTGTTTGNLSGVAPDWGRCRITAVSH